MKFKKCKYCGEEIAKNAKRCPKCGGRLGMPGWAIALIMVAILIGIPFIFITGCTALFIGAASSSDSGSNTTQKIENKEPENIEYIIVSKDQLNDDLKNNAAAAQDKYKGKYIELTGKLSTIDSDLSYISIVSNHESFDLTSAICYIKNDSQREVVKTLTRGQKITIRGKVNSVGEVLGYSIDLVEIVQ